MNFYQNKKIDYVCKLLDNILTIFFKKKYLFKNKIYLKLVNFKR